LNFETPLIKADGTDRAVPGTTFGNIRTLTDGINEAIKFTRY